MSRPCDWCGDPLEPWRHSNARLHVGCRQEARNAAQRARRNTTAGRAAEAAYARKYRRLHGRRDRPGRSVADAE